MTQAFKTALIACSWRSGSSALNRSLSQHPSIFGWPYEAGFFRGVAPLAERLSAIAGCSSDATIQSLFSRYCELSGWRGEPWVVHKDPQDSKHLPHTLAQSGAERIILLTRNPYAIAHSLLEHFFPTVREATFHIRDYYEKPLLAERDQPALFSRIRYEDLVADARGALSRLLLEAFGLPFSSACLDLTGPAIPRGLGDHKLADTDQWRASSADLWRVGLSRPEKQFIRIQCARQFSALGYDPDDDAPLVDTRPVHT